MTFKHHNDGKAKCQSHEVWHPGIECSRGYGASPQEALRDYREKLAGHATELRRALTFVRAAIEAEPEFLPCHSRGDALTPEEIVRLQHSDEYANFCKGKL